MFIFFNSALVFKWSNISSGFLLRHWWPYSSLWMYFSSFCTWHLMQLPTKLSGIWIFLLISRPSFGLYFLLFWGTSLLHTFKLQKIAWLHVALLFGVHRVRFARWLDIFMVILACSTEIPASTAIWSTLQCSSRFKLWSRLFLFG